MENKPSRRKLHRKLKEKSEEDGAFQDGDYEEEFELHEPEPEEYD